MSRKNYFNGRLSAFICCGLVYVCTVSPLPAAPAAADLLQACEHSLNNGFAGIEGEMCTWYVTPCDCDFGKENKLPRVCLPEQIAVETLARVVVDALKEQPGLHTEDADFAAAMILSRVYPCLE